MNQSTTLETTGSKNNYKAEVKELFARMQQMHEEMQSDEIEIAQLQQQTRDSLDRTFAMLREEK